MELQELEKKYQELGREIQRLKAEQQVKEKYPIYCLSKTGNDLIVKFDGLTSGTVVKQGKDDRVGDIYKNWIEHTECHWEQLEVCSDTGFFDGQLVWCWDDDNTHIRKLAFYDVKNKIVFTSEGKRKGFGWNNYKPFEGNWTQWAQEAFKTLER